MVQEIIYLTQEGYQKFHEELNYLRTVRREEVAARLRVAREDGVYGENFAYESAVDEQAFVEGRIQQLELLLGRARIINGNGHNGATDCVGLNSIVTVQEEGSEPERFHIVGSAEADPSLGKISDESPLGRSLLGKRVGESVTVKAPAGSFVYRIVAIEF
ncbi:MAG: transcription elongation factor GreA [Aggregatilineales bacterium]|nr:transcription elongation factor GreA [Chloroflexota bacterium]HOA25292.1 transcription elongation factor GreA [Aggregatilineales bacterium]HPV07466.1 transcription elongation factor GreA [Aggregatilineales bacterium]HQE17572.1 transcription elongation factor GreA [Aggregatilineales bacterium]